MKHKSETIEKYTNPASLSVKDGLPKKTGTFPELAELFSIRKNRELNLSYDNPQFVTSPTFFLKPEVSKWTLQEDF